MSRLLNDPHDIPFDLLDLQPPAKRTRSQYRLQQRKVEEKAEAVALARIHSSLAPVRQSFHGFLTDGDAARLMRVSDAFASAVLEGYAFTWRIFTVESRQQLRRLVALYDSYGLLITRMRLSHSFNASLVDSKGRSLLPLSLIGLLLGHIPIWLILETGFFDVAEQWEKVSGAEGVDEEGRSAAQQLMEECDWPFHPICGEFNTPLVPGSLPDGLRFLAFGDAYDQPVHPDCFPPSLAFVQFGYMFDQATVSVLPDSVHHVVLHWPTDVYEEPIYRFGCDDPDQLIARMSGKEIRLMMSAWEAEESDEDTFDASGDEDEQEEGGSEDLVMVPWCYLDE